MAKRATPKKRQAKSSSSSRYKAFQNKARKRLVAKTNLGKCPKCKEIKLSHTACPTCGFYKGKSVIDKEKEMDKITKVKA
jgi:large subunit ribosomal protein L32